MRPSNNGDDVLHDFLDSIATRHAHASAVTDSSGSWTYAELASASTRMANWLINQRVRRGDRVAVRAIAHRTIAALLFGCSRIGAILVPVSPSLKRYQLETILDDAEPALFLTDDPRQMEWSPARTHDLVATLTALKAHSSSSAVSDQTNSQQPVLLLYTSGSTAAPKGVLCTHGQVCFAARAIAERLRYQPDDVIYDRLPLSFDYGLYQILLSTFAGSELVLADTCQHAGLLAEMRRCGATVVPLVPSLAAMLLTLARREHTLPPVRLFTNTGEHLPAATARELRERFPGAGVRMMFGTTECKRISIGDVDGDLARPDSVGRPLADTEVRIVDEAGETVHAGQVGEITVRGPHLMVGYWRDPNLTRQVWRSNGSDERVLHTGDYGWLDTDGYLYFHGRHDDLFKRRGTRISTAEIEAAAEALPGVHFAVAIPPSLDRDLALYVTGTLASDEVLRQLRGMLDAPRVPATCHRLETLPLTPNGKIDRHAVADLVGDQA